MDMTDTFEQNKKQLVDKANEFADNAEPFIDQAKPYVDKMTNYAKANPIEAMVMSGIAAFVLGAVISRRR